MRCTIYAQISGLVQEAKVISEFPQWGSNSKEALYRVQKQSIGFSPRNGEVILKLAINATLDTVKVSVPAMGK